MWPQFPFPDEQDHLRGRHENPVRHNSGGNGQDCLGVCHHESASATRCGLQHSGLHRYRSVWVISDSSWIRWLPSKNWRRWILDAETTREGSSTRIKIVDVVVTLGLIDSFLYLKAPQSTLTSSPLIMVHNRIGKVEPRYMSHISSMPSSKTFARPPSRVSNGIPGYSLRMEMIRTFFPFPLWKTNSVSIFFPLTECTYLICWDLQYCVHTNTTELELVH